MYKIRLQKELLEVDLLIVYPMAPGAVPAMSVQVP